MIQIGKQLVLYYVYDIPYCVLINKDGKIIYSHLGYKKGDEIEMKKELLINSKKLIHKINIIKLIHSILFPGYIPSVLMQN